MATPLLNVPGYTSYLYGDERPLNPALKDRCDQVMYENFMQNNVAYYKPNFARFVERVLNMNPIHMKYHPNDSFPHGYPTDHRVADLRYYYNRQLIFQMCNIPTKNETVKRPITYPTIPIQRNHDHEMEVQMDIMYFTSDFTWLKQIQYYVVIIEPYTRYMWAFKMNVVNHRLLVSTVNHAIKRALERGEEENSDSYKFYQFLRANIRYVRTDQGGEFKDSFADNMKVFFPNSIVRKAYAKNNTFGRPNTTGPVEAGIRMLRRTIRDQTIGALNHNRQLTDDDLQLALEKHNQLRQLKTLGNSSPQEMANALQSSRNNNANNAEARQTIDSQDRRTEDELKNRLIKRNEFEHAEIEKYPNVGDVAFRFYIDHGQFPKETDIRVSLNLFRILRQRPDNVDLEEIPPAHRANGPKQVKLNIRWEELVMVKTPVEDGPNVVYANFIRANFAIRRNPVGFKEVGQHNENDKIIMYAPPPLPNNPNNARLQDNDHYNLAG
jgi:hypothetical protein